MVVIKNTSTFNQRMSQILRLDLSVLLALRYIVFKCIISKSRMTFRLLYRYGFCFLAGRSLVRGSAFTLNMTPILFYYLFTISLHVD